MVSNVTVNGKQLGGKCLKDSGCFIAISLKSISCFPFTTFKAMNQPRLHLSGAQHRGKLHTVYFTRCFAFCLKASTQEKNQNSSLFRGRGQSFSRRLPCWALQSPVHHPLGIPAGLASVRGRLRDAEDLSQECPVEITLHFRGDCTSWWIF